MNFIGITASFLLIFSMITYSQLENFIQFQHSTDFHTQALNNLHTFHNNRATTSFEKSRANDLAKRKEESSDERKNEPNYPIKISKEQFRRACKEIFYKEYGERKFLQGSSQALEAILNHLISSTEEESFIRSPHSRRGGKLANLSLNNEKLQDIFYQMLQGKNRTEQEPKYLELGYFIGIDSKNHLYIRNTNRVRKIIERTIPEIRPEL